MRDRRLIRQRGALSDARARQRRPGYTEVEIDVPLSRDVHPDFQHIHAPREHHDPLTIRIPRRQRPETLRDTFQHPARLHRRRYMLHRRVT